MKRHVRHFWPVLLAWAGALSACQLDQQGMVLMIDPAFRASVAGTTANGFTMPDGILWRNGELFMADEGGSAVRIWTSGHNVRTLCDKTLGIREPEDLVMDGAGNLFFTDDTAGGLWEVDTTGRAFELAGRKKGLFSTEGIVLAPWGDILVGDGVRHEVFSVSRSGKVSVFLDARQGIKKPESMVYDERGTLYIADNVDQVVYTLSPDLKLKRLIEGREDFSPETIWYANHVLYITDSKHGKLSRFTAEEGLKTIALFGGKLQRVCGITTDDQGHIFVSIQSDGDEKHGYIVTISANASTQKQIADSAKH